MQILQIIMLLITLAIVYNFGKMLLIDSIELFCFNPSKITFKDKREAWVLIECERNRIKNPLNHKCNHSYHNLLNDFPVIKKPQIVKDVISGKFNKNTNLKEYYKGRK